MNESLAPMMFTVLWLIFCALWAAKSLILRRHRAYAQGKRFADKNPRFKYISYGIFVPQVALPLATFFSDSILLLKIHSSATISSIGLALCYSGLALYLYAQKHLGKNYSPCFDSHIPFEVVSSGPYRLIRHPGWLAKLMTGLGTVLASGSAWFAPAMIWIIIEMRRTIRVEEAYLIEALPDYNVYRSKTFALFPYVF